MKKKTKMKRRISKRRRRDPESCHRTSSRARWYYLGKTVAFFRNFATNKINQFWLLFNYWWINIICCLIF